MCFLFALQIIICMFCPFLILPLIHFVPDEHTEREAAARRKQKSLNSKSMRYVRRRSDKGEGVEMQKVETVNGNPKITTDEEVAEGGDGDDLVDYIPGKRAFRQISYSCTDRRRLLVSLLVAIWCCVETIFRS